MDESDRRGFLRWCGLGVLGGLTGCLSGYGGPSPEDMPETTGTTRTTTTTTKTTTTATTTTTRTTTAAPASFELVGIEAPEKVEIGQEFDLSITVENVGGRTGTFTSPLYYKTGDSDWKESGVWRFESLPPGETRTVTRPVTFEYLADVTLRLSGFEPTSMRVVPRELGLGKGYVTPDQFELTVTGVELRNEIQIRSVGGQTSKRPAAAGKRWALLDLKVKNVGAKPETPPGADTFKLLSGHSQYEPYQFVFDQPVADPEPYEATELHPSIIREGGIVYEVPAGVRAVDLTVAWSESYRQGTVAVYWNSN